MEIAEKFTFWKSFYIIKKKITDPMERLAYLDALIDYAFEGKEPTDLPFAVDLAFEGSKPNVVSSFKNSDNREKGGRPSTFSQEEKELIISDYESGTTVSELASKYNCCKNTIYSTINEFNNSKTEVQNEFKNSKTSSKSNITKNMNMNLNNEYEFEQEEDKEEVFELPRPSQDFATKIFELWKESGLPCNKGEFVSFIQGDFKNALQYVRNISSEDVIQAAKNFVDTISNPHVDDFWKKQQPTFDSFCSGKLLKRFLPDNFRTEQYLKAKPDKQETMREKTARSHIVGADSWDFISKQCNEEAENARRES